MVDFRILINQIYIFLMIKKLYQITITIKYIIKLYLRIRHNCYKRLKKCLFRHQRKMLMNKKSIQACDFNIRIILIYVSSQETNPYKLDKNSLQDLMLIF